MGTFFALAVGPDRKAISILGEDADLERARVMAASHEPAVVVPRENLGMLAGPELIKLHNVLVPPNGRTDRFPTKAQGVRRVLAAWDARKQSIAGGGYVIPAAMLEPRRTLVRSARGALQLAVQPREKKRWQKGSARHRAYEWLCAHPEATLEETLTQLAALLGMTRTQVRGLLDKLKGVSMLKVGGS